MLEKLERSAPGLTSWLEALPILISVDGPDGPITVRWIADDHPDLDQFMRWAGRDAPGSDEWLIMVDDNCAVVSEAATEIPIEPMLEAMASMIDDDIRPTSDTLH